MDYPTIDQILSTKGFASDPAFDGLDDLTVLLEPIPRTNSCPLGLYDPDTITITLPPDASEATLLHELGHRHGHYYYGDLSERYAEDFRRRYQKGRVLLYTGSDFNRLPEFGKLFEEGEKGAVEIALDYPLAQDELYGIRDKLYSYPERLPNICYGNSEVPWVRFEFTKGVDWLVIIGSVLAATTLAGVGAIGYAIYKTAEATPWVVPVALAGVGAVLLLRAVVKEAKIMA